MALAPHVLAAARAVRSQAELVGRDHRGKLRPKHQLGKKRIPPQQKPIAIEADYAKAIIAIIDVGFRELAPLKDELPKLLASAREARGDAADELEQQTIAGIDIVIENPAGSLRRWTDSDGTQGETLMRWSYGYIKGVIGADGEDVDVYVGPDAEPDEVFVIHQQRKADDFQTYDEDKVMLGWASADAAKAAYLAQYDDPRFYGGMTVLSLDDFKARLQPAPGDEAIDVGKITHEQRQDAGESARVRELFERARRRIGGAINSSELDRLARRYATATTAFQHAQLARQVKAALGVDVIMLDRKVPAMIEHFVGENSALIRSLANRSLDDVEKTVAHAFTSGARAEDVQTDIAKRYGIHENHARLIARDQIGTLNGQVNATRQKELGIAKFTWRTMEDERVRPEHEELDGQVFAYDDPPSEGLPGTPILCRCGAEPVFDGMLDDAEDDAPDANETLDAAEAPAGSPSGVDVAEVAGAADAADALATPDIPEVPAAPDIADIPAADDVPAEPAPEPTKNPKRVEAARKAGEASAERQREIHSAVRSNLPPELHVAWDKEGHKFLRQEAHRIKGVKDRINAASKMSEAFAETYGSGEQTAFGNEGDRFHRRAEIEAKHAEAWADEQERKYYEEMQRDAERSGDVAETGELTDQGREQVDEDVRALTAPKVVDDDEPPF